MQISIISFKSPDYEGKNDALFTPIKMSHAFLAIGPFKQLQPASITPLPLPSHDRSSGLTI